MPVIISKSKEINNNGYYQLQTKEYAFVKFPSPKPSTQSVIPVAYTLPCRATFFLKSLHFSNFSFSFSSKWASPGTGMYFIYMTLSVLASYRKTLCQADDVKWRDQSELWNPMIVMSFLSNSTALYETCFKFWPYCWHGWGCIILFICKLQMISRRQSRFSSHTICTEARYPACIYSRGLVSNPPFLS